MRKEVENMDERRTIPRWRLDKDVSVSIPGRDIPLRGRTVDINLKGMQIALPVELPDGAALKMDVSIGRGLAFSVEATVPWRRHEGGMHYHGLQFTRLNDADKDSVGDYVRVQCADQWREHWWEEVGHPSYGQGKTEE
ncbi:MAG: PilZ domain-containing protein [Elusimicrobia bacterium]|nr:PilZ domain-containing protein [Elusimicrobiota bacterium]